MVSLLKLMESMFTYMKEKTKNVEITAFTDSPEAIISSLELMKKSDMRFKATS